MRSLALLLLLLNVTFFTWQQSQLPWLPWQPEQFKPTLQVTSPERSDLPQLQLVGESSLEESVVNLPEEKEKKVVKQTPVNDKTEAEKTNSAKLDKPEVLQETKTTLSSDSQQTKVALKTEPEKVTAPPKEKNQSIQKEKIKTSDAVEATQQQAEPKLTCVEIGPYSQQATAENSAKWFQSQQKMAEAHVEARDVPIVTQTRVYLVDFETKQEARLVQQRLTQHGIVDHAIFTINKSKTAISLGVYSNEDNAKKRVNQLKEKGYNNVKMEKQQKNDTKYWLNVKMSDNHKEVLDTFRKAFKTVPTLRKIACK